MIPYPPGDPLQSFDHPTQQTALAIGIPAMAQRIQGQRPLLLLRALCTARLQLADCLHKRRSEVVVSELADDRRKLAEQLLLRTTARNERAEKAATHVGTLAQALPAVLSLAETHSVSASVSVRTAYTY